jgi:hypothetical protein
MPRSLAMTPALSKAPKLWEAADGRGGAKFCSDMAASWDHLSRIACKDDDRRTCDNIADRWRKNARIARREGDA